MKFERILAIKLADLGDLLLTEPALRSVRTAYPEASVDLLTTPASSALLQMIDPGVRPITFAKQEYDTFTARSLIGNSGNIGRLAKTLRNGHYDAVLIFHNLTTPAGAAKFRALAAATGSPVVAGIDNGRGTFLTHRAQDLGFGSQHTVDYMLSVAASIGGASVSPAPQVNLDNLPAEVLPSGLPERFAAIFPVTGPFAPGRNWPVGNFAELSATLDRVGIRPVLLGASDASAAATEIMNVASGCPDLTGKTSLGQLIRVVERATVVVTGDSFPAHLAAALKRPLVAIFGPSNHRAWGPYGAPVFPEISPDRSTIVRHDVPCSPCLYTGYRLGRRNGCGQRDCLTLITADEVAKAALSVMDRQA